MTSVKQHLISFYYCNDLMLITGHGPLSHLWERFTKANDVAWDHEKTSLEMLDLIIEGKCTYKWLVESYISYSRKQNRHLRVWVDSPGFGFH